MLERQFTEPALAALYDGLCGTDDRDDFRFYLPLIAEAGSVLDVGCGTGALLHLARDAGHRGRLVGLDPAPGMLAVARKRRDIEWVEGDLTTVAFDAEFDLAVMTGHAFQQLVTDDEIETSLRTLHRALAPGGVFAFETRNPMARAWEGWTAAGHHIEFTTAGGSVVWFEADAEPPDGDVVRFTATYGGDGWRESGPSTLRFLDTPRLDRFLADAGFTVGERYGDWDRSPLTDASPEIITIARADRA